MKKRFLLEIEYEEKNSNIKNNSEVLQEVGIEVALEYMMEEYKKSNSIVGDYAVTVKQA